MTRNTKLEKYLEYTKSLILTPRHKFWSVSFYDQPVSRYRMVENKAKIGNALTDRFASRSVVFSRYYNSPLTTMLGGPKGTK